MQFVHTISISVTSFFLFLLYCQPVLGCLFGMLFTSLHFCFPPCKMGKTIRLTASIRMYNSPCNNNSSNLVELLQLSTALWWTTPKLSDLKQLYLFCSQICTWGRAWWEEQVISTRLSGWETGDWTNWRLTFVCLTVYTACWLGLYWECGWNTYTWCCRAWFPCSMETRFHRRESQQ